VRLPRGGGFIAREREARGVKERTEEKEGGDENGMGD